MEELMKKSIFIQRESFGDIKFCIKEYYEPNTSNFINTNDFIMIYSTASLQKIDLDNATVIKEINISMPLLNKGDSFYFENEKKIVIIKEVMRTDKDSVVYTIEDKITYEPKSLEQYEIDKQKYLDIEKLKKELEQLEELKEAVRTKDKKKIKELIKD